MPVGGTDAIGRMSDFYFLNVYLIAKMMDMFSASREAYESGTLYYMAALSVVLLLVGIPAYVEESSCFMTVPLDEEGRKWQRGYSVVMLMQANQVALTAAHRLFGIALVQLRVFSTIDSEALPLHAPGCDLKTGMAAEQFDDINFLPSCLLLKHGSIGCQMQSLFSSPHGVLFYSAVLMSIIVLVYTLLFGKTWSTYSRFGRLYFALLMLCSFLLTLHFYGSLPTIKKVMAIIRKDRRVTGMERFSVLKNVVYNCIEKLGLFSFCISIVGSKVGERVRQNFVWLAAVICFSNVGVIAAFGVVHIIRTAAVNELCNFNSSREFKDFFSIPYMKNNGSYGVNRMMEMDTYGFLVVSEAVMMFRETSGYVPWTVSLPIQIMLLAFSIMLVCNTFFICDLFAADLFRERKWRIVALSALRFGLLFVLQLLELTEKVPQLSGQMSVGIGLTFHLLRMAQCVIIHLRQGFGKYLQEKRLLIPSENYIQLFAFDWYIGPAILYMYNLGHLLLLGIVVVSDFDIIGSTRFFIVFLGLNFLPTVTTLIWFHCR